MKFNRTPRSSSKLRIFGFRVASLIVVLAVGLFTPTSITFSTCRCCLWTSACDLFPVEGNYEKCDSGGSTYSGTYNKPLHMSWPEYQLQDVSVRRTRYGWPLKTVTVDKVADGSEWHRVFEFWFWPNTFLLFLLWLLIQWLVIFAIGKLADKDRSSEQLH